MKCPNCATECELVNVKSKLSYECGCGFSCPTNHKYINEIYTFISKDSDGNEKILNYTTTMLNRRPMVTADRSTLEELKVIAREIPTTKGVNIRLLKFTTRTEITDWERN